MSQTQQEHLRQRVAQAKRVVVKIGSRSIAGEGSSRGRFEEVAGQISRASDDGRQVVLVSSGAALLGWRRLGLTSRPQQLGQLQAAYGVGQSRLMQAYDAAFHEHGRTVAEVLLTHADLAERERYLNARSAVDALLDMNVVPIINENGTVAFDELARFGDNDQLAAMVATLVGADLLVLMSDVEGLLDGDGARIPFVHNFDWAMSLVRPKDNPDSLGGMESKLEAARRATRLGVPVVLADARLPDALDRMLAGEDIGTCFAPHEESLASRKHWIAFTLKPLGSILVDEGAARALVLGKRSLLPAGVTGVAGDFRAGDAVRILAPNGKEIARGLSRYSLPEVALVAGAQSTKIPSLTGGHHRGDVVIHRDDMVVF